MGDSLNFQDFRDEADDEGIVANDEETEEEELKGSGMHVEGGDDEEIPEMESDI